MSLRDVLNRILDADGDGKLELSDLIDRAAKAEALAQTLLSASKRIIDAVKTLADVGIDPGVPSATAVDAAVAKAKAKYSRAAGEAQAHLDDIARRGKDGAN